MFIQPRIPAYFKRWVLIPFYATFQGTEQIKDLLSTLTTPEELSGLLNFALDGLKQLLNDGGFEETSVSEVQREYEAHSNLGREFLQECYIIDTNDKTGEFCVQTEQVHTELINWFRKNKERRKYLMREGLEYNNNNNDSDSDSNDNDVDMDNEMVQSIAIQILGKVLIDNKVNKKPIQVNKERNIIILV